MTDPDRDKLNKNLTKVTFELFGRKWRRIRSKNSWWLQAKEICATDLLLGDYSKIFQAPKKA